MTTNKDALKIVQIPIVELRPSLYNPRKWSEDSTEQLKESIRRFGLVDPILVNKAPERKNIVIGGHFRLKVAQELGFTEVPVVYIEIADEAKERELNLRLNKNLGEWDYDLLKEFDHDLLDDIGFSSTELDDIFLDNEVAADDTFDLKKELEKLDIENISVQKGDIYQLAESRLMCGDSTIATDFDQLMDDQKADMCMTDPPYILDYVHAQRGGKPVTGFVATNETDAT